MVQLIGSGAPNQMVVQQADAVISQANPVSTTLYTALATAKNVRVISIIAQIDWAVTQPTPLEIVCTIDGQTLIFAKTNPVSGQDYTPLPIMWAAANSQESVTSTAENRARPFLIEGRSIKIEARVTWAITQPTPLICRVKYATIP